MILPLSVWGRCWSKAISRGATAAPSRWREKPKQVEAEVLARLVAGPQRDEGLHHLSRERVGLADHAGLGHRRVLH